jgi:CRP-like cAMP-binding protein
MYVTIPSECAAEISTPPLASTSPKSAEARLKPGAYLFFEGDEVEWLYQVTSGVLRLTRLLADGRRQVIAFGYPGDIVGFPAADLHHTDCEALTAGPIWRMVTVIPICIALCCKQPCEKSAGCRIIS